MSTTEIIGKLFGSIERVKILRLFMMNPNVVFTKASISRRSKVPLSTVNRELKSLFEIHFIRSKISAATEDAPQKSKGWQFDSTFPLTAALKELIFPTAPFTKEEIIKKFKNTGRIKLIIIAGVFIKEENSRADILIVGDNFNKRAVDNALRSMEAEIGRELDYSIFETDDFKYRLGIYDKYIRDLLDYSHEVIIDKIGVTPTAQIDPVSTGK